jgi:hypothetical protein
MGTVDRFGHADHSGTRERAFSTTLYANAAMWFAVAAAGMAIAFVGLAIDAYRHNNGAEEESLLSFSNPGHLVAGIGLVITTASVLLGFTVAMLRDVASAEHAVRRFVPVTAMWVLVIAAAVGSLTYVGASGTTVGHSHADAQAAAEDHGHDDAAGDAGVAAALEDEGLIDEASQVDGALTQGSNGEPGGKHDHGKQPTFTQVSTLEMDELLPLFPEGTMSAADFPAWKSQVLAARQVALNLGTMEDATAAGYTNTTSDVPYMGMHFLNFEYVRDGVFDPSKPEGLLFSQIDGGAPKLVGVWYLLIPGIGGVTREVEPAGFAGDLDLWHAHVGLCLVGLEGASEGETRESCAAKGGRFTADLRWMMHVWVTPETTENPDGVFAYLNGDLYSKQAAQKEAAGAAPSGNIIE